MRTFYANMTLTLSALALDHIPEGELFRPRDGRLVSLVQISHRLYKQLGREKSAGKVCHFVLPVHVVKEVYRPGHVNSQAWTLQEQIVNPRVLHWGPAVLHCEYLLGTAPRRTPVVSLTHISTFLLSVAGSSSYGDVL